MILKRSGKASLAVTILLLVFLSAGCALRYEPAPEYSPQLPDGHYIVDYVIDGDTIVAGEKRVRLLGINTPEEGEYFYNESTVALMAMIEDKAVIMEKDETDKDRYGRLLRYIFLEDFFINLELVYRGFANVYTYPPDTAYNEVLLQAEEHAREKKIGLWKESEYDGIEIMLNYNAPGDDRVNLNGEYVILKNVSGSPVNLTGWTIKDMATKIYRFPRFVLDNGRKVYIHSGKGTDTGTRLYWNSDTPVWNNDGDTLYLRDCKGALVGFYSY